MKTRISNLIIIGMTCAMLIIATNVVSANSEVTIFMDNFESYSVGSYPSSSWTNLYSGTFGYVTNEKAYSGTKSYKAQGQNGWSRNDIVPLSPINSGVRNCYLSSWSGHKSGFCESECRIMGLT